MIWSKLRFSSPLNSLQKCSFHLFNCLSNLLMMFPSLSFICLDALAFFHASFRLTLYTDLRLFFLMASSAYFASWSVWFLLSFSHFFFISLLKSEYSCASLCFCALVLFCPSPCISFGCGQVCLCMFQ